MERVRKQLAGDLVTELRGLEARLAANAEQLREHVEASNSNHQTQCAEEMSSEW